MDGSKCHTFRRLDYNKNESGILFHKLLLKDHPVYSKTRTITEIPTTIEPHWRVYATQCFQDCEK